MDKDATTWGHQCSTAASIGQPSPGLLKALGLLDSDKVTIPGFAIDLGCGLGRDTRKLLDDGWNVLAVDSNPYVIEKLQTSVGNDQSRLRTQIALFENTDWRPATLINASLALPYCPREQFGFVWSQILASLIPGGIVVADFFCLMPDQSPIEPKVTSYSKTELDNFLTPLNVEFLQEWQGDFVNAKSETIKRLVYTVIARRARY